MREKVAQRILSETLSVRQAEGLARQTKRRKLVVKRKPPGIEEAETFLKQTLGTAVKIVPGLRKGRLEIEYYGDEDLNRLLDLFRWCHRPRGIVAREVHRRVPAGHARIHLDIFR